MYMTGASVHNDKNNSTPTQNYLLLINFGVS